MKPSPLRHHPGYLTFLGHRLSGLALAVFLPLHFWALGTALEGEAALDAFLAFTDNPLVKFAEWGLVILLTIHMMFGVRVLLLEFTPWPNRSDPRLKWIIPGIIVAVVAGMIFAIQVL